MLGFVSPFSGCISLSLVNLAKKSRGEDMVRYVYFILALSLNFVLHLVRLGSAYLVSVTRSMLAELVRQTSELDERRQVVEATRRMNACHCMRYAFRTLWNNYTLFIFNHLMILNVPSNAFICLIHPGL